MPHRQARPTSHPAQRLLHTQFPGAGAADVELGATGSHLSAGRLGADDEPGAFEPALVAAGTLPISLGYLTDPGSDRPATFHIQVLEPTAVVKAGLTGLVFTVASGDGSPARLAVAVDYATFANAAGADFGSRLRLIQLPSCFLTTPAVARCQRQLPLPASSNSGKTTTVTADATAGSAAAPTVLAAVAGPAGSQGSFTASSLAPSGSWSVAGSSGSFDWSYPLTLPPAASGDEVSPDIALSYNSAAVDGRISSTNNQSSWIGEGWSYEPGFIERTYRSCIDDPAGTAPKTGDLCWAGQIVTMSLGGRSTPLVLDDATHTWHAAVDNGQKIELLTGASNGAQNGEHWRITTADGVKYYFGLNRAPGSTASQATGSTWTVPVYGAHAGDPCNDPAGFAQSSCTQAWRWNLDYVEDPHGNATAYYYAPETNYYGADTATTGVSYTRGGTLSRIDYGMRLANGSVYGSPASDQVSFSVTERCQSSTFSCDPAQFTAANASYWPDTPQDQQCLAGASCANHAPTFWSTKRLSSIDTKYYNGTGYTKVDSYALTQSLPVDGDPEVQLDSLVRTGFASDGSSLAMPPVTFVTQQMANRVDGYHTLGPMLHHRLTEIDTETGSSIAVTYSPTECSSTNVPADPAHDSLRCFPVKWTPPGNATPILDYFHLYVVTQVQASDDNAISPPMITKYNYVGAPAWHADDNEVVKPTERSYGQYRGYGDVEVRTGNSSGVSNGVTDRWTLTKTSYFRGMGGTVSDSLGESVADDELFVDSARETQTYDGDGGQRLTSTIADLAVRTTTASRARTGLPALTANVVVVAKTRTLTNVTQTSTTAVRTATSTFRYDDRGRVTAKTDAGDAVASLCTSTSYAENTTSWIRDRVAETITSSQACPPEGTAPTSILSDIRNYYDGTALSSVGTLGEQTRTETATDVSAGVTHFAVTTNTYDAAGRPLTTTDASGDPNVPARTTQLSYTPATGGPLTKIVSQNAALQSSTSVQDPGRGSVTQVLDVAGLRTDAVYDQLGRLTSVWSPGQTKGVDLATTSYAYLLRQDGPSAVTTSQLIDNGAVKTYRTSIELLDAFGRVRQTQTQAHPSPGNPGGRTMTDTFYDSHGWTIRTNNHWDTSGAPDTTLINVADASVNDRTLTSYDGAGRPSLATEYKGLTATWSTRTVYGGDRTTVVPPTGTASTTTLTDVRGDTTELDQWTTPPTISGNVISGGTAQKATYHYTAAGQRDQLTTGYATAAAATWSSVFDLAGRVKSQSDPDSGLTSTTYNDFGEPTSTVDAKQQTLSYSYDVLGRKTSMYSGTVATGTKLTDWVYDTLQVGKLSSSTRHAATGDYTVAATGYDAYGNQTGTTTTIPASQTGLAGSYTTGYTFSTTHLMLSQTPATSTSSGLPTETINYSYTPLGLAVGETGYNAYVSDSSYSPYGQPLQYTVGVNTHRAWLNYSYDAQTGRVSSTSYSTLLADPQLDNTAYTYDASGNITRTADTQGGASAPVRTECFSYDALVQLKQAWTATDSCATDPTVAGNSKVGGPSPYWTSWSIDAGGSRTQQIQHVVAGGTGSNTVTNYNVGVTTPTAHAHAVASTGPVTAPTTSYGYDAVGNTTSRIQASGTQTLSYDTENRISSITTSAGATSYTNTADGDELIRRDPTTTTLYLPGEELVRTNSTGAVLGIRYYSHNGVVTNLRRGSGNPIYLAPDPHGTNSIWINSTTYAASRRTLDPYGAPIGTQPAWPDYRGYLDKPSDSATGLTDVGAREYDPSLGRFISVDPQLDPANPLQSNGYSYAGNNPVTFSDPTGLMQGCDGPCHGNTRGHTPPTGIRAPAPGNTGSSGGNGMGGCTASSLARLLCGGISSSPPSRPRHSSSPAKSGPSNPPAASSPYPKHPTLHKVLHRTSVLTGGVSLLSTAAAGACTASIVLLACDVPTITIASAAGEASAVTDLVDMLTGGEEQSTSGYMLDVYTMSSPVIGSAIETLPRLARATPDLIHFGTDVAVGAYNLIKELPFP